MNKQKINTSVLQDGDIFFTSEKKFIPALIRFLTKSKVSHVGQLICPYSVPLLYRGEMTYSPFTKYDDLKFNPLHIDKIVSIKRPLDIHGNPIYTQDRIQEFRKEMISLKYKITYDFKEFFSCVPLIGSGKDRNKKDKICSRLVYHNLVKTPFVLPAKLYDECTPEDIYTLKNLIEVPGWDYEQKKDTGRGKKQ